MFHRSSIRSSLISHRSLPDLWPARLSALECWPHFPSIFQFFKFAHILITSNAFIVRFRSRVTPGFLTQTNYPSISSTIGAIITTPTSTSQSLRANSKSAPLISSALASATHIQVLWDVAYVFSPRHHVSSLDTCYSQASGA